MRVAIVATHAHPLPSPAHTGDSQVILDLCHCLHAMGHEVNLYAPKGTTPPDGVDLSPIEVGSGEDGELFERVVWGCIRNDWGNANPDAPDVVHDFSIGKFVARWCSYGQGRPAFVSTLLGGCAYSPLPNTVVWSQAMRARVMRGATDYEGTRWPEKGGPACEPFRDVRVVYGGVDTEFYSPGKLEVFGGHFLWMNRWSPEKGPLEAIEMAKSTGIELLMVGAAPGDVPDAEQAVCLRAMLEARGCPNIRVEHLPNGSDHHTVKRDHYRRAMALLYPAQFQEPFGLSMVEAMACGCPVVGLDMGSVPEVVGFAWGSANGAAINGPWTDARLSARNRAVSLFDWFVMARNYLELYREVIGGGGWG